MIRHAQRWLLAGVFLACLLPCGFAGVSLLAGSWLSADLDGDRKPDLARATGYSHGVLEIDLWMSGDQQDPASHDRFRVHSASSSIRMVSVDVDGDSDRDLVVEDLARKPLAILINDGHGRFHQAALHDFEFLFHRDPRSLAPAVQRAAFDYSGDHSRDGVETPAIAVISRLEQTFQVVRQNTSPALAEAARFYTRGPPFQV
jgi:hypothetical protein